jgi:N-acyl-L-homoserine lactone synthetase
MNSSSLTDAISAARAELVVHLADTPELVEQAYRLRHQVYCLERGYEPSVNDLETDAYDKHARHVVLSLRGCGTVIGTVRMILPQACQPTRNFPMQAVCDRATLSAVPLTSAVEVSRFAVSKERRNVSSAAASLSRLALVRGLVQLSQQGGVTHWCAVMERTLLRLLRSSGIHFEAVGPLVEYHGLRQPAVCELASMLDRMRVEQPEIWDFVTNEGQFVSSRSHSRALQAA